VGYTGNQSRKVTTCHANAPIPASPVRCARAIPEWHGIQYLTGDGTANYNALAGKLTQRYAREFDYHVQLHLVEGNGHKQRHPRHRSELHTDESLGADVRLRLRGVDVPHRFVSSAIVALPFGKGQRFANTGGVLNQVIGGWQLSTITTIQSGLPISTESWDSAGMGAGFPHSNRLNCVAGVSPVPGQSHRGPLFRS
jgi:hypothetical protein